MKALLLLAVAAAWAETPWSEQGVVHNLASPRAALHSVPVRAVRMGEGFWRARMKANVERSLPALLTLLESHGIVDNFRRLHGKPVERRGPLYTDSDLYKWMEAGAFVLQSGDDAPLRATIDRLTGEIAAAQEPSGYLNTYYVDERKEKRFSEMQRGHELYCLGHLLQAGIAYYRATGNRNLLAIGMRFADYLTANFGPAGRPALTGHPELEMALVELYRTTGERRYLEFAGYLLSGVERERLKLRDSEVKYMFSGTPFTARSVFEGHAVRAMYAASGATDYWVETGEAAYGATLERLWRDAASSKTYITGGVGSRSAGEAFGEPYELPNAQAYTESCAAIAAMMWNWRLLLATGEARFAGAIERALYNGINSGMSLGGTLYCYRNPLESAGEKIRNEWYDTTCCPPNLERTLASLPGYLYGTSRDGVWVNFFHASTLDWKLEDGTPLTLTQSTGYPWQGVVTVAVTPARPMEFTVHLRVPEWAAPARVTVNGRPAAARAGEYLALQRTWKAGDTIRLELNMAPRLTEANARIREDAGRVAVERGPLVYCLEQPDNLSVDVLDAALRVVGGRPAFREQFRRELLGGMITLEQAGEVPVEPASSRPLYAPLGSGRRRRPVTLTLIPYYAWANRGTASMQVWLPLAGNGY